MNVKIYNKSDQPLPEYKTQFSAGMDLHAAKSIQLQPLERKRIPTGLHLEIPEGVEGNIRPRSGLSLEIGLVAIEGTVDADYRGEISINVVNLSNKMIELAEGARIAQIVFNEVVKATLISVDKLEDLSTTERGENGFGSTGR